LGGGIPRRNAPILQKIREEVTEDGKYSLVLVFEAKALELSDFEKRQVKLPPLVTCSGLKHETILILCYKHTDIRNSFEIDEFFWIINWIRKTYLRSRF